MGFNGIYPLVMTNVAIENGPVEIVDFPIKKGDFNHSYVKLPCGWSMVQKRSWHLLKAYGFYKGCWKNEVEGILWPHEKIDEHEDQRILGWFFTTLKIFRHTPVSRYKDLW